MREGDLGAAMAALDEGRSRERGYELRGRRADYHAVFLAGLCLEAGDYHRVAGIVAELSVLPHLGPTTVPALDFHLACRQGDVRRADALLDTLIEGLAQGSWRSGDQAHDLVSAAVHAGLPLPRVVALRDALRDGQDWGVWQDLVEAQLAEVEGSMERARRGYAVAAGSTSLPPSVRGTAYTALARCHLAADQRAAAVAAVTEAGSLLRRWRGWRTVALEQVRGRLGLAPTDGESTVTGVGALTPREREVALLIADGLTNAELARRLYISPKTAAVHVSNILRKLGIASRGEVTGALGPASGG
jgi:DNA-binding CsgD family transcriptional regulator